MKVFSKLKQSMRRTIVLGAVTAAALAGGIFATSTAHASMVYNCDDNAVVTGGVSTAADALQKYNDGSHCVNGATYTSSAKSIQDIYSQYGINSTTLGETSVEGTVGKNNDVYVDGQVVATGAVTAGRQDIAGSTKVTMPDGTVYYRRQPSVSFLNSTLPAIIYMKNGVFQSAVINSCGNPVSATPLLPSYSINKLVAPRGSSNYTKETTVQADTQVAYQIDVTSTGKVAADNINVKDVLPKGVTYVAGSLTEDNAAINDSTFFTTGYVIPTLAPAHTEVFVFDATVGLGETNETCTPANGLVNSAEISAPGLPNMGSTATVNKTCAPKPAYSCTDLTAAQTAADTFNFTAKASATNGAVITGYTFNFGDGKIQTNPAADYIAGHTYATAGTYNATVAALVSIDGAKAIPVTSSSCAVTVTITPPPAPAYSCTDLTVAQETRTEFNFTASAKATNGAVITGYTFNFGNGATKTVTAPEYAATYSYPAAGSYTATVSALVSINGAAPIAVTSANCSKPVTVAPAPAAECTDLTITQSQTDVNTISATATDTTSGGATLTGVSFNWGDSTTSNNGTSLTASHTYATTATDQNYNVTATLTFSNGVTSSNCAAEVTVNGVQPMCTNLDVTVDNDERTVTINSLNTVPADYSNATIDWGDSTSASLTSVNGETHIYSGTVTSYTITATAYFTANGESQPYANIACTYPVSFTTTPPVTPPTPVTPTAPTALVNTGPGNVVGMFAVVTILGAFAYRTFVSSRINRGEQ